MGDLSDGGFVLNVRTGEAATPDEAAALEPKLVPLRNNSGATMELGRLRWYVARLKELESADGALGGMLVACLTEDERARFDLAQQPLSDWLVAAMLERRILTARTDGFPWTIEFVAEARRVVRAAIATIGPVSEGKFRITDPILKPKAPVEPKPS